MKRNVYVCQIYTLDIHLFTLIYIYRWECHLLQNCKWDRVTNKRKENKIVYTVKFEIK